MTRTSTESPASLHAYRRTFWFVVVSLLAACAVFAGISFLQGPRLVDTATDPAALVAGGGGSVRLYFNQPLATLSADRVSVAPEAPIEVDATGEVVTVTFPRALAYDTEYTITVAGVTGASLPQAATVRATVRTPSPSFAYLHRGDPDEIVATSLTGTDRRVLFTADEISDFTVVGQVLAVATIEPDGGSALQLVSLADGAVESVPLPEPGRLSDLAATSGSFVLAMTFTPTTPGDDVLGGRRLLLLDLEAGRSFTTVSGLDGEPMLVTAWRVIPGRPALVVQSIEQTAFVVDAAPGSIPTPIGRIAELVSVSADGATLAARDALGGILVDLGDGTQSRIDPSLIEGGLPFLGFVQPLTDGSMIEKAALETTSGRYVVVIAVDDGTTGRILYTTPELAGSIEGFSASPNEQLAVIEVVPSIDDAVSDAAPVNPRATSITTVFVDVATGALMRSVEGFDVHFLPATAG